MGRPLNKKYFGNRNIGTTSTTDNKIGGEGVASITTATPGSININNSFINFPTLTVAAPTLPTGVTAITAVTWEIDTVVISGGTTYTAGNIDSITGLTPQATVAPIFSITVSGGVPSFSNFTDAGTSRGEFTSIDGTGITTWAVVKGARSNAQATITFRVKSITLANKGSGYVSVPSLSWTALSGTSPSGQTPTLTTDSGAVGSVTNQENAILAYAWTGSSRELVDIVKQESSRRYAVKNATPVTGEPWTVRSAILVAKSSSATNEMDITAVDSAGKSYWVTKLTARKALLTRKDGTSGYVYATGQSAPWKFDAATGIYVQIDNA